MASPLYVLQLAGFQAAGNPATGSGLLGSKMIHLLDDGSIQFTTAAGNTRVIHDNFELNALLKEILVGANGVSSTKKFHT